MKNAHYDRDYVVCADCGEQKCNDGFAICGWCRRMLECVAREDMEADFARRKGET